MLFRVYILLFSFTLCYTNGLISIPLTLERNPDSFFALQAAVNSTRIDFNAKEAKLPTVVIRNDANQYFGEIKIGTPPQKFVVAFGTAFSTVLVPSLHSSYNCRTNHNVFNYSASSTFNRTGTTIHGHSLPYTSLTPSRDTITVGDIAVANQSFGLIEFGDCDGLKYDGIFGLGFPVSSKEQTVIGSMYTRKIIMAYVVGLYFNRDLKSKQGGEITLGGTNLKRYNPESLEFLPAGPYSSTMWELEIRNILIGSKSVASRVKAILDSSVSFIGIPKKYIQPIKEATNAQPAQDGTIFLVSTSDVKYFPSLTFNIAGKDYTLQGSEYVDLTHKYNGRSFMLIRPIDSNEIVLGNAFLGKYYTILDYNTRKVAFAALNGANGLLQSWMLTLLTFLFLMLHFLLRKNQ